MRKLASIREIADIKPIEGADKIELAIVDGWEVVVSKSDNFKIGDKIVYIEIDSIVPETPEFEFLRKRKFRVRTIKLRNQISQGLVLPLDILPCKFDSTPDSSGLEYYTLGMDVTDILGIKKYDPELEEENKLSNFEKSKSKNPIIKYMLKFKFFRKIYFRNKPKENKEFPEWISKTDETRIQNIPTLFENEKNRGTKFIVTEKIDGQSATYFLKRISKRKFEFGVCSRNLRLNKPNNSNYWKIAEKFDIENVLRNLIGHHDYVVLQGEIYGEGVQANKYKVKGLEFAAFNLIYPDKKISTDKFYPVLSDLGISTVPILDTNFELKDTIHDMVEYSKGKSLLYNRNREGIVVRNYDNNISFKVINPEFLLEEK